jgi:hypothetical protein
MEAPASRETGASWSFPDAPVTAMLPSVGRFPGGGSGGGPVETGGSPSVSIGATVVVLGVLEASELGTLENLGRGGRCQRLDLCNSRQIRKSLI